MVVLWIIIYLSFYFDLSLIHIHFIGFAIFSFIFWLLYIDQTRNRSMVFYFMQGIV